MSSSDMPVASGSMLLLDKFDCNPPVCCDCILAAEVAAGDTISAGSAKATLK